MFDQLLKTYPAIKHRPLKTTCKTLDVIENQLNFPKDRIISHGFLFTANTENIEKLISEVKEIGNVDIKEILYKHPLLIKTNYESILKMKQILKVFTVILKTNLPFVRIKKLHYSFVFLGRRL